MDTTIIKFKYNLWNKKTYNKFITYLKSISDDKYALFQTKLIPNNKYNIIGVRIPILRKIANIIFKGDYNKFISISNNNYLEEILIKSFIISKIKNRDEQIKYIQDLIPLLNNWCLCDTFVSSMKCIKLDLDFYYNFFSKYNNRIMVVVFLNYYLIDEYIDKVFDKISNIETDDYYINMAISWLMCEAYVNYKNRVNNYLNNCKNDDIIKMTKSKIRDSRKIKES